MVPLLDTLHSNETPMRHITPTWPRYAELQALNSMNVGLMAGGWATDNSRGLSFLACSILMQMVYAMHEVYVL